MYESNTILTLKDQRAADDETGEQFPYNKVKVVGPSPISHASTSDWSGVSAAGVIVTPLSNFGGVLDEPLGKLQALYDVTEVPVLEIPAPTIRIVNAHSAAAGPTPEEVFAETAPGVAPAEGLTRGRTSPLADPRPAPNDGPLGSGRKPKAKP